ncbi:hypothetical protein GFS31_33930 [Leptolyngbya sp. BL0902]|nr:hypothetical protein GFS31_33930 [Leptolyngbya sp. BL0902]
MRDCPDSTPPACIVEVQSTRFWVGLPAKALQGKFEVVGGADIEAVASV